MRNVVESTEAYERWLGALTPLIEADLKYKHELMAKDAFSFLRGTFYRWAELFEEACGAPARAPELLAVGDLHVENFGTWRDSEGRLVWGVNDFDEAHPMPYTVDLVRLAASAQLAISEGHLRLRFTDACAALLDGYARSLAEGGRAVVLAGRNRRLRRMTTGGRRDPELFWKKLNALPAGRDLPRGITAVLERDMPPDREGGPPRLTRRRAGVGSLGRQRVVGLATWHDHPLAREAKAAATSAWEFAHPAGAGGAIHYQTIVKHAVRCPDPFLRIESHDGEWVVRRLAPDCSRIELAQLPANRDELRLLDSMGWETANVHLGSREAIPAVREHLAGLPAGWLRTAAGSMVEVTRQDWRQWRSQPSFK